jgi:hypothetical protein
VHLFGFTIAVSTSKELGSLYNKLVNWRYVLKHLKDRGQRNFFPEFLIVVGTLK